MTGKPIDGGPIYAETDLSALISEPWNAISSLAILLPAVYWAIRLKGDIRNYTFMYYCMPLLFLGGLGSTLFHAFRASHWLLLMDVLPTALLTLSVSIYFWIKVMRKIWLVPLVFLPVFGFRLAIIHSFPGVDTVNVGYLITGIMIFLPLIFYLFQSAFRYWTDIIFSVLLLILSLVFRERDHALTTWLPMGSHFLWHILSGIGAYFLGQYLYKLRRYEMTQTHSL